MASKFCKRYFQHEEKFIITQLNNTRQRHVEDHMTFVKRFCDLALDYYDKKDKEALVKICISNNIVDYKVYLENISIGQFLRLLEAIKKTSMSI